MWWKQPSVTRGEERVIGGQSTWCPLDSSANAGTLSIPITTHSYRRPTPASESDSHIRQPSTHSPTCMHLYPSRLQDEFLCFPGTWEKTTAGIQMAKNPRGASLRTQESAPCSAPTSLSAVPKTSLSVVRDSTALFVTKYSEVEADFRAVLMNCLYDIILKAMHWNPYEST